MFGLGSKDNDKDAGAAAAPAVADAGDGPQVGEMLPGDYIIHIHLQKVKNLTL